MSSKLHLFNNRRYIYGGKKIQQTTTPADKKHLVKEHSSHAHEHDHHNSSHFINRKITWIINISLLVLATMHLVIKLGNFTGPINYFLIPYLWIVLSAIAIFTIGFKYFRVYHQLIVKKELSVNLLMAFAAHLMFIYSTIIAIIGLVDGTEYQNLHTMWTAIIYIVALMDIGHSIEARLNRSSQSGFDKLKALDQRTVRILYNQQEKTVAASEAKIGDTIVVDTNEVVPLDGVLLSKHGQLDTSNITGESKQANLVAGKYVVSGSINRGGKITIRVNKSAQDSTISRIINRIQTSTTKLTKSQASIAKLIKFIIPTIFLIALVTFITWMIIVSTTSLDSLPWSNVKGKYALPFDATFTVLDIAAPCALGMAIPLLIMVSSFIGGTNSIVFNSIKKIEDVNNVKVVAFDKTGTITEDRFEIVDVQGDQKLLPVLKSLEANVNHPLAKSIYEHIAAKEIKISNRKLVAGKGVTAIWNGHKIMVGKSKQTKDLSNIATFVALFVDGKEAVVVKLEPKIKPNAIKVIRKLLKKGLHVVMITGDNQKSAQAIADRVGITEFYAETSPEEKLKIVKKLQQKNGKVMYIGDGFNDLAASRQADISVAFASGDEILNDLTDISLITNDLNALLKLFELSRLNSKAAKFSVGSVFILSFALIPFAMLLIIPPFAGAIIMILVDILVVWNAWFYKQVGTKKISKI